MPFSYYWRELTEDGLLKDPDDRSSFNPWNSMRKTIVATVAALLGVDVRFPDQKEGCVPREPRDREYRLTRRVWYDGTVHWYIEQFVSELSTLEELYPNHPTKSMLHINGKPVPRNWIPLPKDFGTEEEAIEYLNGTLRPCEVLEEESFYID